MSSTDTDGIYFYCAPLNYPNTAASGHQSAYNSPAPPNSCLTSADNGPASGDSLTHSSSSP